MKTRRHMNQEQLEAHRRDFEIFWRDTGIQAGLDSGIAMEDILPAKEMWWNDWLDGGWSDDWLP